MVLGKDSRATMRRQGKARPDMVVLLVMGEHRGRHNRHVVFAKGQRRGRGEGGCLNISSPLSWECPYGFLLSVLSR